ncbi:MAG: HEAT repeat domain-containing protein [Planctomycetota bacterium]|jgi:HEAT repeat protein/CheY-like chemotaxis protein
MATGGTPLARVFLILVLIAVPAALITFDGTAAAQESEAVSKLTEGLKMLRAGQIKEAIQVLREALALEPSNKEAMAALGQAEWSALLSLMADPEGRKVAVEIMNIATPRLPEKAFDEKELQQLVTTAVTDEAYGNRFDAAMSLARVYGEFAVPHLIAFLRSSNTEHKINAHITLMNRIGRDAVLPLNEAVLSGPAQVRLMVAGELGVIGDERSLAAVAESVSSDEDNNVRTNAARSFEKLIQKFPWAADMTASELYLRLAKLYYSGDFRVMAFSDRPLVLWSWGAKLEDTPVPRHLYVLKLAEEACYDALRLDEGNLEARALLARVLASEKISSDAVAEMAEDEMSAQYAAGLANTAGTVAALGWTTLSRALTDCLDQDDAATAAFLLRTLPHIYGGADFTMDNPVVRATSSDWGGVRLAAAEAVLRFNGSGRITAFPDPDGFISLVARAAGEVVPRYVLVIDSDDARRNKVLSALNKANYLAFDARSGADGIVRALRYAGLDLVVLSSSLADMEALGVIRQLKADTRTKDTPIVVHGTPEQVADEKWTNLYKDRAARLVAVADGPGMLGEDFAQAIAESFGGESPGAKARYDRSAQVLDALAGTDTGNALFNWNALTGTLTGLLTADVPDDPPVRLNALRALANLGDPAAMGDLISFFGSTDDNPLKAAAGRAIAAICHAGPQTLDEGAFKSLLAGTQSDDEGVRAAAFGALGSASLTDAQALAVAKANRPASSGGGGEEEDM